MHKQLEKYLHQLRAQMQVLPADQREAEVQEIRQHLEILVHDYRQTGLSEELAVTQALAQFGSSRANGRALSQAWNRGKDQHRNLLQRMRMLLVIAWLSLFACFVLGNRVSVSPAASPAMPQNGDALAAINQQHQIKTQAIQGRWNAENLAIQRMDKRDADAVSQAQGAAMTHFQKDMNAVNLQWQTQVQTLQHQRLISLTLLPAVGMVLLTALILLSFLGVKPLRFNSMTTH